MNRYKRFVDCNVKFKTNSVIDYGSKRRTHDSETAGRAYPKQALVSNARIAVIGIFGVNTVV